MRQINVHAISSKSLTILSLSCCQSRDRWWHSANEHCWDILYYELCSLCHI